MDGAFEIPFTNADSRAWPPVRTGRLRLVLCRGEALTVPCACRSVTVLAGIAWLTSSGRDIVLRAGESYAPLHPHPSAVISALREGAVVVELERTARIR